MIEPEKCLMKSFEDIIQKACENQEEFYSLKLLEPVENIDELTNQFFNSLKTATIDSSSSQAWELSAFS